MLTHLVKGLVIQAAFLAAAVQPPIQDFPRLPEEIPQALLVVSREILQEYLRVLETLGEEFPGVDVSGILELLTVKSELTAAPALPEAVCVDPDDDKFLACAVASKVKHIISGDKHLLKVSGFRGVEVVKPRKFIVFRLLGLPQDCLPLFKKEYRQGSLDDACRMFLLIQIPIQLTGSDPVIEVD